ncbi:MAG: glycosyltransferase family 2 protein [candidate division NC10 bacterium]|nr:glycosyltransferase family 2 protein [candidate division NC10 bacterium]
MNEASPSVSVVIITRNEASRIRACLDSVRWAAEVIVVDQFSQDGTPDICREFGARVYQRELTRFGEQKQFAVDRSTGEWIFNLDADERVPPGLRDEILEAIASGRGEGVAVHRPGAFLGQTFAYRGVFTAPLVRGFRRDCGRFTNSHVDEEIVVQGRVLTLKTPLVHSEAYSSLGVYFDKFNRYTSLTAQDMREKGVVLRPRNYAWYFFLKPLLVFFQRYILKRGFRQGLPGFLWYVFRAMSYFVSYAKLWEMQAGAREEPPGPKGKPGEPPIP